MFNKAPRFLESSDIIDIIDNIQLPSKEKKISKKESSFISKPIEEQIILSKPEHVEVVKEIKTEQKNKSSDKIYRYAGDDIPWLY